MIGVLVNNQWSVGGNPLRPSVNAFLAQPFVNYNMAGGWYLTSSPFITANWLAAPGQQWTVPIGGGLGRLFKIGDQPVSAYDLGFLQRDKTRWLPDLAIASIFLPAVPREVRGRLRVHSRRFAPPASPAMSAMPPKADVSPQHRSCGSDRLHADAAIGVSYRDKQERPRLLRPSPLIARPSPSLSLEGDPESPRPSARRH